MLIKWDFRGSNPRKAATAGDILSSFIHHQHFYLTAKEVRDSALGGDETGFEDENDVTTDTDNESEADFDSSDDDEFDLILSRDYNAADDNMKVDWGTGRGVSLVALVLQRK